MANTPKIRFKGFTDDWEQRKLGELVSFSKGSGYSKGDLKENGTPIILYGRLYTKYETVISEVDTFVDAKENSVYSKGGEVIVPGSGETAEDISIASVVKKSGVLLGGDLNIITPPKDIDAAFLAISISNGKSHNDMAKMAQGKSVVHLHNSDLAKIDFSYPTYQEQCKISRSFSQIDHLITLHQRKCDETKKLKKFMLQKMFPKNGEKNPEIRFAGFTDDWEQRKLGEICERLTRKNKDNESDLPLTISSQHGLIDQRDFFNKVVAAKDMSEYYLLQKGEFAYNKSYSNGYDYGSIKRLNSYEKGCLSTLYICFKLISDKVNSDYLECYFDTLAWYYDVSQICSEGARNHGLLNVDVKAFFTEVTVKLPVDVMEQQQISAILHSLDHLITLHQRKCDNLKLVKKFMLQNMFPQKG